MIILLFTVLFGNYNNSQIVSGNDYYTDENGDIYIFINVLGHVESPGSHMVYEGADILTVLAQAGGYLKGAKTSEILIIPAVGKSYTIDLDKMMRQGEMIKINFKPNDTIHIDETNINYILSKGNIVNVFLQITNLILIATNNR